MSTAVSQIEQMMADHVTGLIGGRLDGPQASESCQFWHREVQIGQSWYSDSLELAIFDRWLCFRLVTATTGICGLLEHLHYSVPNVADPSFEPSEWFSEQTALMLQKLERLQPARVKFEAITGELWARADALLGGEFKREAESDRDVTYHRPIRIGSLAFDLRIGLLLSDCYFMVRSYASSYVHDRTWRDLPAFIDADLECESPHLDEDENADLVGLLDEQLRLALRRFADYVERVRKGQSV